MALDKYERDLLIRIDERVNDINNHLARLNGSVEANFRHLDNHSKRLIVIETEKKMSKKALAGYISGIAALIAALWKAYFGNG